MKKALLILVVFGFIFAVIPTASFISTKKFLSKAVMTTGTVLKTGSIYSGKTREIELTVSFVTREGKIDTGSLRLKQSVLLPGDNVKFYFDPANPKDIRPTDNMRKDIIGLVAGWIFFLTSLFFYIKMVLKDFARKKLVNTGIKISAENISVDRNRSISSNGKNPFVIKCTWIQNQTNKKFTFISKDFWHDPQPQLSDRRHIDVYIDPNDPNQYYMDTSFITKKG